MKDKLVRLEYRKARVREGLRRVARGRPRLSVHRSLKYIEAQVIDDIGSRTLACASSRSAEFKGKVGRSGKNLTAAKAVGELIARKALQAGIQEVCFDRGGRLYHGRIKALAEAARAAGLRF